MRKIGSMVVVFLIVIVLVIVEIVIVKGASKYEPQTEVVFAKVRIPEKTLVTAEMLEVKKVGIRFAHGLSVGEIKEAAGKKAKTDIEAGEMLLSSRLGYEGMERIEVKDKNKRLFAVEFKGDQANGWWLMSDQYADIIFVPDEKNMQQVANSSADAALNKPTDMKSLAEGKTYKLKGIRVAALIDDNGKLLKNKDRTTLPKYISFEVTDEEAVFLAYAKSRGRLEISLIPD